MIACEVSHESQTGCNAMIDIRFGTRTPPAGSKFLGEAVAPGSI